MASNVNGQAVGGKKRSRAHDTLWNAKYLNKFKWAHLTERLAYERAVHQQRMRAEIAQAKRSADHFRDGVEREAAAAKRRRRLADKKEGETLCVGKTEDSTSHLHLTWTTCSIWFHWLLRISYMACIYVSCMACRCL